MTELGCCPDSGRRWRWQLRHVIAGHEEPLRLFLDRWRFGGKRARAAGMWRRARGRDAPCAKVRRLAH